MSGYTLYPIEFGDNNSYKTLTDIKYFFPLGRIQRRSVSIVDNHQLLIFVIVWRCKGELSKVKVSIYIFLHI